MLPGAATQMSLRREAEHGGGVVDFTGTPHGLGEVRLVDRVGEILGFQAEGAVAAEIDAAGAIKPGGGEEVGRVELYSRLVREHFQDSAAAGFPHPRRQRQRLAAAVQDEVVVVASRSQARLLDPLTDAVGRGEIQRGTRHGGEFPRRDQAGIHAGGPVGGQDQFVVMDRAAARKVEVAVVGQVDGGRPVGRGAIMDSDFVPLVERIGDGHLEVARVSLFAVDARVEELHGRLIGIHGLPVHGPKPLVEADLAPVQVIGAVVDRQLVALAVNRELAQRNPVGHPAGDCPKERMPLEVTRQIVEPQDHVAHHSAAVRHVQFGDDQAIVGDLEHGPLTVTEGEERDCASVWERTKVGLFEMHGAIAAP